MKPFESQPINGAEASLRGDQTCAQAEDDISIVYNIYIDCVFTVPEICNDCILLHHVS